MACDDIERGPLARLEVQHALEQAARARGSHRAKARAHAALSKLVKMRELLSRQLELSELAGLQGERSNLGRYKEGL